MDSSPDEKRSLLPDDFSTLLIWALIGLVIGAGAVGAANYNQNNDVETRGLVPLVAPDGMQVNTYSDTYFNQTLTEPYPTSGTVEVGTEHGNISFFSSGDANATIYPTEITSEFTVVRNIEADPNSITITPEGKDAAIVTQEITRFEYRANQQIDDGAVDFRYESDGPGEVTVQGVAADTRIAAVDSDSGQVLDETTSSGAGAITFDSLESGDHDVQLQAFTPKEPTFSDASPTGLQSTPPDQISVRVEDGDFPRGDSVSVTIDVNGNQVHSESVSSNQTITTSVPSSAQSGGDHDWSIEADDSYGESNSSAYEYSVPSEIQIREESPPYGLIEEDDAGDPITVQAIFFEDVEDAPTIVNRTTTDGTIDLEGLPVSSEFSVQIQAAGYHNRTVRLDNIFTQSNVFLVNQDEQTIENRFVVSDRTGNFPPEETQIVIEGPVNQSLYGGDGFDWLAVAGDDLGADESFVTNLIEEKRYRIVVTNDDGDTRVLGAYTAETTGTINLNIGNVQINPEHPNGTIASADWQNESGQVSIRAQYNDTSQQTDQIWLKIYEYKNESNVLLSNTSYGGPFGTFSATEQVPAGENDTQWVVELIGERSDGSNYEFRQIVGPGSSVLGDMPNWLITIIFGFIIFTVAGLSSQLTGGLGGIVVAGVGAMLWFVGMSPDYLGGGVVALALIAGAVLHIRDRNAGGL